MDCAKVDEYLAVDACLDGAGGVSGQSYYRLRFPKKIKKCNYTIVHLEMWAVIIAVRLWGSELFGKIVTIKSDNEAVARIVNTGRSYDLRLQKQLRELNVVVSTLQYEAKKCSHCWKIKSGPRFTQPLGGGRRCA